MSWFLLIRRLDYGYVTADVVYFKFIEIAFDEITGFATDELQNCDFISFSVLIARNGHILSWFGLNVPFLRMIIKFIKFK